MSIWFESFLCNLIIYAILSIPVFYFIKSIGIDTKRKTRYTLIVSCIAEVFLFTILYMFPEKIFSLFPVKDGVKNAARFISRIIFICSSLNGYSIVIPIYLFKTGNKKRIRILVLSKILTLLLIFFFLFMFFGIETALFSIPCIDFLFDIIFIYLFSKS